MLCKECDACMDICPVDCLSIVPLAEEAELRKAVRNKDLSTVERLRAAGYNFFRDGPNSALVLASGMEDPRLLRAILGEFRCHEMGKRALHAACGAGRLTNVELLLSVQSTPYIDGALHAAVRARDYPP